MATDQKRIIFSTPNPNDQGGKIPNNVFDWERYKKNPVILRSHDWQAFSIGLMTDIKLENNEWSGVPVFHKITEESRIAAEMYDKGFLRSSSIGGNVIWKTTGEFKMVANELGQQVRQPIMFKDEAGYMVAEYFDVYEISLPTLPSNPEAVTEEAILEAEKINLSAIYADSELDNVHNNICMLSTKLQADFNNQSQLNLQTMAEKKETKPAEDILPAEKSVEETPAQVAAVPAETHVHLAAKKEKTGFIPKFLQDLIGLTAKYAAAHPEGEFGDEPITKEPEKEPETQPTPTGLTAKEKAEKAVEKAAKAKKKMDDAENDEEKEAFKADFEACHNEAEKACKEAEAEEEAEEAAKKPKAEVKKEEAKKETSKNSATMEAKPIAKTLEELGELKLAAAPSPKIQFNETKTFSKLSTDKGEGEKILNRIFNGTNEGKSIDDYRVVLNSVLADPKYKAIGVQSRFHMSSNMDAMYGTRKSLNESNRGNSNAGIDFREVAARLNSGIVEGVNYKLGARGEKRTTLSTDGSFSSLDTVAVEWLPLIIYRLFPSESWKSEIPVFGVQETGRNLGVIWTNIGADPNIYRGAQPTPAAYSYSDTAVGVKLVPYWMQPTRWNPLYMHQLRYDQQASGWAQALAKLEAQVGDDLLYTFGAGALANGQPIIYTGGPIDNTQSKNFTVGAGGNGVDKFYFNPAYAGSLLKPGFNDVIAIEQQFNQSNFDLKTEKPVLVVDSITESYIAQDKQTQSMLTRWVNENGADVQKIKHTAFHERSRVLAFDPIGNTIIDTHAAGAVIPATTQSANLAFVSSQLGIALGKIDVFFVQDPANYGFTMSMDMRIGGRALRNDYTGVNIYAYGNGVQAGS